MSDPRMNRWRRTGVLLQTLLCWTLIEHCYAGNRPFKRGERPRYTRHHDRWTIHYPLLQDQGTQRIEYPSVNDEGTQGLRYPSVHDRGQRVHYPSVNDSGASSPIQVKICEDLVEGMFSLRCGLLATWRLLSESKGRTSALQR